MCTRTLNTLLLHKGTRPVGAVASLAATILSGARNVNIEGVVEVLRQYGAPTQEE